MTRDEKLESIRKHLEERFSEFRLEHEDRDFPSDNYYFRFYRKGQGLRVEFTRELIDDFAVEHIMRRLGSWSPPPKGNAAVRVYRHRIEDIAWDPTFGTE